MTQMKKLVMLTVLIGMLWAGLGSGVREAWAAQCGIGCPAGSHPESYYCDTSCGLCVNVCSQASICQPNGNSFYTCGSCPSGYRTDVRFCNTACIVCGASCFGLTNAGHCTKI